MVAANNVHTCYVYKPSRGNVLLEYSTEELKGRKLLAAIQMRTSGMPYEWQIEHIQTRKAISIGDVGIRNDISLLCVRAALIRHIEKQRKPR